MSSREGIRWEALDANVQDILHWALASVAGAEVSTNAMLLGTVRARTRWDDLSTILDVFGISDDAVVDEIVKRDPRVVAYQAAPPPTDRIPEFTIDGRLCLGRAVEIQAASGDVELNERHLLQSLMSLTSPTRRSTADQILAQLLPVQLTELRLAYVDWLHSGTSVPLDALLRARFANAVSLDRASEIWDAGPVFVSFSAADSEDVRAARGLAAQLRTRGIKTWLADENLRPGDNIREETAQVLESASAFLLLVGRTSQRFSGLREVDLARQRVLADPGFRAFCVLLPGSDLESLGDIPAVLSQSFAFDLRGGDGALDELARVLRVAAGLEPGAPPTPFGLGGGVSSDYVDPNRAIASAEDRLGVGAYVSMLALAIADRKTPTPLSVGLFGQWGSGKSYFMGLLRGRIDELAKTDSERYCGDVVQIGFNAWHYADSNLWASLAEEIFRQLAGPREGVGHRRGKLRQELTAKLDSRHKLTDAQEQAVEREAELRDDLRTAAEDQRTKAVVLARVVAGETWARQDVGWAPGKASVGQLSDELEAFGDDTALLRDAVTLPGKYGFIAGAALAAIVCVATLALAHWVVGAGAAVVAAVLAALESVRRGAAHARKIAERVRREREASVAAETAALDQAERKTRAIQADLKGVRDDIKEIENELAQMRPGKELYRFIAGRNTTDDYRGQLGLVSTIRKDFEQLVALMQEWAATPADERADDRQPIERVVLYIDDLDRCSPEQVVDVLQAVHLLLAFDLFVVVVGVDPRWLLRSLETQYRDQLGARTNSEAGGWWDSTPKDYLEKIFNIPFALPRMSDDSFGRLLQGLAGPLETSTASAASVRPADVDASDLDIVFESESVADFTAEPRSEAAEVSAGNLEPEMRAITEEELQFLTVLHPLVPTPREGTRLINLYRMIRSTRDLGDASEFLGVPAQPGDYQAVAILLGVLAGAPALYEAVVEYIAVATPDKSWGDVVAAMKPVPAGSSDQLQNELAGALSAETAVAWTALVANLSGATRRLESADLQPFRRWAPRVARFSFRLSAPSSRS